MSTATAAAAGKIQPRLKQIYKNEIQKKLQEEFQYANVMQIPGLVKVVVNTGVGEAARDSKVIDGAVDDLTKITGQKPIVTKARKSIAQFKLREGQAIGAHVTLRGDRAWEFIDRLVNLALPRIRDFRGLSDKQFDGHGNYTFGLQEQSVTATTRSVCRSSRSSTRSTRTASTACVVSTSRSSPPHPPTTRAVRSCVTSASRSAERTPRRNTHPPQVECRVRLLETW